jgi:hypothetical protein
MCQPPNNRLQRTVIRHHGRAASAALHCAHAARLLGQRAAAEPERYTVNGTNRSFERAS